MGEHLKQANGNEALAKPVTVPVTPTRPGHVFDLVSGKKLGRGTQVAGTIDLGIPPSTQCWPRRSSRGTGGAPAQSHSLSKRWHPAPARVITSAL